MYLEEITDDEDRLLGSAYCPFDACRRSGLPCRCTKNCSVTDQCDKSHHPLYNGVMKDVIFGIACPPEMQQALTYALRNTSPTTKLVTIIVNLTRYPTGLTTELETMKKLNVIDPDGEFTAKLFFEQVLEPTRRWFRGTYSNPSVDKIVHKLQKDDHSQSLRQHYALHGCVHERRKYEQLRERMLSWSKEPIRLQYIFMEFAGDSLATLVVDSLSKPILYDGIRRLLCNYSKLYEHGISHLDMHDSNLTWSMSPSDGADEAVAAGAVTVGTSELHIKFIDFGFYRMLKLDQDDDPYLQHVQPDKNHLIMDVTKWFTRSCDVSVMLRWWHPIEYPMFHLCASLLLAPLLLPGGRWTRQHHANHVLHLAALVVTNNLVQSQVMDYGSFTDELLDFFRICPLMGSDPDHNECKRFTFFGSLFSIFGGMQHCYILILPLFQRTWKRVCSIVGVEVSRTMFWPNGRPCNCGASPHNVCQSGSELFSLFPGYRYMLDHFRTQYYYCTHLDLSTVEREFDTFSLAMNILKKTSDRDLRLRQIVMKRLLSSKSFESNRTKLADTVTALAQYPGFRVPIEAVPSQPTDAVIRQNSLLERFGKLGKLGELSEFVGEHGFSHPTGGAQAAAGVIVPAVQPSSAAEGEGDEITL